MAVDTEAKRWSMLNLASGVGRTIVFNPDTSSIQAIERATVLKLYGGIAFDTPAPATPGLGIEQERRYQLQSRRHRGHYA